MELSKVTFANNLPGYLCGPEDSPSGVVLLQVGVVPPHYRAASLPGTHWGRGVVPCSCTQLRTRRGSGQATNGCTCLWSPPTAAAPCPQEWWGVTDTVKAQALRIAAAGHRCLVPDLYRGEQRGTSAQHVLVCCFDGAGIIGTVTTKAAHACRSAHAPTHLLTHTQARWGWRWRRHAT